MGFYSLKHGIEYDHSARIRYGDAFPIGGCDRQWLERLEETMNGVRCAPFIRQGKGANSLMMDMMLCVSALLVCAAVLYGVRVMVLWLAGTLTAVACEAMVNCLTRSPYTVGDWSAAVTGSLIALLCPACAPYFLPMLGSAFAVLIMKMPCGGLGCYPVNPTAAAWCLMAACWPAAMFTYPSAFPRRALSLAAAPSFREGISSARLLQQGALAGRGPVDILLGKLGGPMGSTMVVVIAACACYLIYRRTASYRIMSGFLLSAAVLAALFPRSGLDAANSVFFELCSGSMLFCAVFVATEPVSSPFCHASQWIYGMLCGAITMLLRHITSLEQAAPCAIVLCCLISPLLDLLFLHARRFKKHGRFLPSDALRLE